MDQSLIPYLTLDEYNALRETEQWYRAEASSMKKMVGLVRKPADYLYEKIPEKIRDKVAQAILKVLTSVRAGTTAVVSPDKVYARLEKYTGPLGESPDFLSLDIRKLDQAAQDCIKRSKNSCTVEGAATGVAGLPGIALDVPALYGLLFHSIQEVSLNYGYPVESEVEQTHMLKILNVGHHVEREARIEGMEDLARFQELVAEDAAMQEVEKYALQRGLQTMARQLARLLIQRKLSQSVVLVGGVVGAGVNRQLAGEVGLTCFHTYRCRFLRDLARARKSGEQPTPPSVQASASHAPLPRKSRLPTPPSYD